MAIGEWSSEAMARRYIETLNVFAAGLRNYADLVFAAPAGATGGDVGTAAPSPAHVPKKQTTIELCCLLHTRRCS